MDGITEKDLKRIREELDNCARPLFLYDDDPDGFCSFLLLYRYKKEGKGIIVKRSSLDYVFADKVKEYQPDKVFILDIPKVEDSFVNNVNIPIIWIDHHTVKDFKLQLYVNPKIRSPDAYVPVSAICCAVVKQDAWVGAVGSISDAYLPDFLDQITDAYPALIKTLTDNVMEVRYNTPLGKLVKIISLILKDRISKVNILAKIMSRVDDPVALLEGTTPEGKYIHKAYNKINKIYEKLKLDALQIAKKSERILYFEYGHNSISVTTELANELFYLNQDKIVIVARQKDGNLRMSLRYKGDLPALMEPVLNKLNAVGGGHLHACGASIKAEDREFFLTALKNALE